LGSIFFGTVMRNHFSAVHLALGRGLMKSLPSAVFHACNALKYTMCDAIEPVPSPSAK